MTAFRIGMSLDFIKYSEKKDISILWNDGRFVYRDNKLVFMTAQTVEMELLKCTLKSVGHFQAFAA